MLSFDDFINKLFDGPDRQAGPLTGHRVAPDNLDLNTLAPSEVLLLITRLFEEARSLPERFSSRQIGRGLWYICDPSCSDTFFALTDNSLPWSVRERTFKAINTLYADLFAKECSGTLVHNRSVDKNVSHRYSVDCDLICYMFWDIAPLGPLGTSKQPVPSDSLCLDIMSQALSLPNNNCQESAIHGLEHWALAYRQDVTAIIADYLKATPSNLELASYAASIIET